LRRRTQRNARTGDLGGIGKRRADKQDLHSSCNVFEMAR
jgi:hypothetical protein